MLLYVNASKEIQDSLAEFPRGGIQDCRLAVISSEFRKEIPKTVKTVVKTVMVVDTLLTLAEIENLPSNVQVANKNNILQLVQQSMPRENECIISFDKKSPVEKTVEKPEAKLIDFPKIYDEPLQVQGRRTKSSRGEVIASFSTKGGVGKTTVAVNIGVLYALKGLRTILVDFDLGAGDAPEKLGLSSSLNPNVGNWRQASKLNVHRHSSGLYVLPSGPDANLIVQEKDVEDLVNVLEDQFDIVILDYGVRPFHQHTRAGLDLADRVFLIADQEQNMIDRFISQFIAERGDWISQGKADLVVNAVSPLKYYKPSDVAQKAGFTSWYEVPELPSEFRAATKARKAVVQLPKSLAAPVFYNMIGEAQPEKQSMFARLLRR